MYSRAPQIIQGDNSINSDASNTASSTAAHAQARRRESAIKGAFYSEVIDMFDIYLPVVVLSPVLGYFQPSYLGWLGHLVSARAAPAALLCIGGVIATLGAAMGPETKDVDF